MNCSTRLESTTIDFIFDLQLVSIYVLGSKNFPIAFDVKYFSNFPRKTAWRYVTRDHHEYDNEDNADYDDDDNGDERNAQWKWERERSSGRLRGSFKLPAVSSSPKGAQVLIFHTHEALTNRSIPHNKKKQKFGKCRQKPLASNPAHNYHRWRSSFRSEEQHQVPLRYDFNAVKHEELGMATARCRRAIDAIK